MTDKLEISKISIWGRKSYSSTNLRVSGRWHSKVRAAVRLALAALAPEKSPPASRAIALFTVRSALVRREAHALEASLAPAWGPYRSIWAAGALWRPDLALCASDRRQIRVWRRRRVTPRHAHHRRVEHDTPDTPRHVFKTIHVIFDVYRDCPRELAGYRLPARLAHT
jgi:hypothetical protein